MPTHASPSKPAAKPAKPAAKSAKSTMPTKTAKKVAVKPTVKAVAPAPAIKENAAAVKAEAKKIKAAAKETVKEVKSRSKVEKDKDKPRKPKLVRDSFTMPEDEYAVLGMVKKACLKAGIEVKKSELLRIGVSLLRTLDPAKVRNALTALPALKAGRPKKSK